MVHAKVTDAAALRSLIHAFPGGDFYEPLYLEADTSGLSLLSILRSRSLISRLHLQRSAFAALSGKAASLGISTAKWTRAMELIPLSDGSSAEGIELELSIEAKEVDVLVRVKETEIRYALRAEEPGTKGFPKYLPDPKNLPHAFGIDARILHEAKRPFEDKSVELVTLDLQKDRLAVLPWPDPESMSYVNRAVKAGKPGKTHLLTTHLVEAARFSYGMRTVGGGLTADIAIVEGGLLMVRYKFEGGDLTHWIVPSAEPKR